MGQFGEDGQFDVAARLGEPRLHTEPTSLTPRPDSWLVARAATIQRLLQPGSADPKEKCQGAADALVSRSILVIPVVAPVTALAIEFGNHA